MLKEADLLNQEVRAAFIKSFASSANQQRKTDAFRAYQCLKDKTHLYVIENLSNQFASETVQEMMTQLSNVSILRKVIEKLARVYSNGVKRTMPNPEDTKEIEEAAKLLDFDGAMKKANRYYRTFKNTLVFVKPLKSSDQEDYGFEIEVKPPFHYDVIPDPENPKVPLAVVLSDYQSAKPLMYALGDAASAGRGVGVVKTTTVDALGYTEDDGSPASLVNTYSPGASSSDAEDKREFIWWTKTLHFTTNAKGEITNFGDGGENPILELPFVNICGDQDNGFWASGGEDLVHAGIQINSMLSSAKNIGVSQGHGQLYMTGQNLPKSIKIGPNYCIQLEQQEGEPAPTIGYLNASPELAELRSLLETEVALMLTTNNLSTSGFSLSLQGGKDFASGIAMMIDKSESIEDVNEQAQVFIHKEPLIWALLAKWHAVFASRQILNEDWRQVALPFAEEMKALSIRPNTIKPVISETEKLAIMEKRKQLGLASQLDLIMTDDPSLTEKTALEKLARITAQGKEATEPKEAPEPEEVEAELAGD